MTVKNQIDRSDVIKKEQMNEEVALVRQCKNNFIFKISLTKAQAPIDNRNNEANDSLLFTTSDLNKEFKSVGKLLIALSDNKRRNIIYLGVRSGFFHLNGIKKLLGYHYLTAQRILKELTDYEIIRRIDDDEKDKLKEHTHRLGMRDYDFDRTDFYTIHPTLQSFLLNLPWNELIDEKWAKEKIDKWSQKFGEATRKVDKTEINIKEEEVEQKAIEFVAKLHRQFVAYRESEYDRRKEDWLKIREWLRRLYVAKITGRDWKKLATEFDYCDLLISCIEKESLDFRKLDEIFKKN